MKMITGRIAWVCLQTPQTKVVSVILDKCAAEHLFACYELLSVPFWSAEKVLFSKRSSSTLTFL